MMIGRMLKTYLYRENECMELNSIKIQENTAGGGGGWTVTHPPIGPTQNGGTVVQRFAKLLLQT